MKKIRYKMLVPEAIDRHLECTSIRDKVSTGEVIRRAIGIDKYLRENLANGKKLILRDTKGSETELVFPE